MASPEYRAEQALKWLVKRDEDGGMPNYLRFVALMEMCERAADAGERVTRDDAYHYAEAHGWSVADAREMFRRDHDPWSVLARLMAMQSPKVTRAVEFRAAPIDEAPLADLWREAFPTAAHFLQAETWQEARDMCMERNL